MTRSALENKFNVQIDEVITAFQSKKIGWAAYEIETGCEICRDKTLGGIEGQLKVFSEKQSTVKERTMEFLKENNININDNFVIDNAYHKFNEKFELINLLANSRVNPNKLEEVLSGRLRIKM